MNCTNCGTNLPPGAATCPVCRVSTPYNVSNSPVQIDPTVVAPQGQYGAPPPATNYGANPYAPPPPPPLPNAYNQYGPPPNQYAPPQQGNYGQPSAYSIQPPPKRRSRVGLIIAIVLGVLLLACVGLVAVLYTVGKNSISSVQATVTAVVATSSSVHAPSGVSVDPTAAGIITNPQMASKVDSTNATPTQLASTFTLQQPVYATAALNLNGQTGYAQAKWYTNGSLALTSKVLAIDNPKDTNIFFTSTYNQATQGIVELYWCTQSDCSDAKLAQVANFTVTATGMYPKSQPVANLIGTKRPD